MGLAGGECARVLGVEETELKFAFLVDLTQAEFFFLLGVQVVVPVAQLLFFGARRPWLDHKPFVFVLQVCYSAAQEPLEVCADGRLSSCAGRFYFGLAEVGENSVN